jgi:serine/threonine protein kinase
LRATDKRTNHQVAVKFLLKKPDTPEDRRSFTRELEILATNTHPATLQLLGFGLNAEGFPMVVTDILANGTLGDVLKRQRAGNAPAGWNATKASICIFGVCVGMAHLHKQNILHRDLKAENIFLNDKFEPVIADFGISRHSGGGINQTMALGTPLHMAPELYSDEEEYDRPVDVYAFAILLYSFFAEPMRLNDKPEPIKSPQSLMIRVGKGARFVKPPKIPDPHWALIESSWAQDTKSRPTFEEMVLDFHAEHLYVLPGADMDQVIEYEERMLAAGSIQSEEHEKVLSILSASRVAPRDEPLDTSWTSPTGDLMASGSGTPISPTGDLMASGPGGLRMSTGDLTGSGSGKRRSGSRKKQNFSWDD